MLTLLKYTMTLIQDPKDPVLLTLMYKSTFIDLFATYVVPTYSVRYDSEKLWEQYHEYLSRIYVEKVL